MQQYTIFTNEKRFNTACHEKPAYNFSSSKNTKKALVTHKSYGPHHESL